MNKKHIFLCFMKVVYELGKLLLKSIWKIAVAFLFLVFDAFADNEVESYSSEGYSKDCDASGYSEADLYSDDPEYISYPYNIHNEENN